MKKFSFVLVIVIVALISFGELMSDKIFSANVIREAKYNENGDVVYFEFEGNEYAPLNDHSGYKYFYEYDENGKIQAKPIALLKHGLTVFSLLDRAYIYEFPDDIDHAFLYCDIGQLDSSNKIYYRSDINMLEVFEDDIREIRFDSLGNKVNGEIDFRVTNKKDAKEIIDCFNRRDGDLILHSVTDLPHISGTYNVTAEFNSRPNLEFDMGNFSFVKKEPNGDVVFKKSKV